MSEERIVCQFSCGAASAVATKLALAKYGAMPAKGVPTDPEHPDRIALDKVRAALARSKEQK